MLIRRSEPKTMFLLFFLFHLTSSEENKIILDTEYLIIASNNIKRLTLPVPINFDDELLNSRLLVVRRSLIKICPKTKTLVELGNNNRRIRYFYVYQPK